jgi:hypothetical protein
VAIVLQSALALHSLAFEQQYLARHTAQPGNFMAGISAAVQAWALGGSELQPVATQGTRMRAAATSCRKERRVEGQWSQKGIRALVILTCHER